MSLSNVKKNEYRIQILANSSASIILMYVHTEHVLTHALEFPALCGWTDSGLPSRKNVDGFGCTVGEMAFRV